MGFRFKCYIELKQTLGEIDSIVESIELATREFIEIVSANGIDSISDNITKLSTKHNIRVNHVNIAKFEDRVIKLHIINVYEQLENYLKSLSEEHPNFQTNINKKDGETDLDYSIRVLKKDKVLKDTIEYLIINHYREIRNTFIHSSDENKYKYINRIMKKIKNMQYNSLSAPNKSNEMNFDDFILFTRAIKDFAKLINQHCQPTDEYIIETIKEKYITKLKKLSNNIKRKENFIKQLLKIEYNLSDKKFVEQIMGN